MCAVSMVGDHYGQQFQGWQGQISSIPRAEFDELKRQVLEMKDLLLKAKEIDDKTGQPDCEQEDKVKILKAIAKAFDVDLSAVFP